MDTPATGTAILVLVAFVLPGFVTLLFQEATYVVRNAASGFERLLLSLSYSVRVYAILFLVAALSGSGTSDVSEFVHGKRSLWAYIVVAVLGLLVLPLAISECGRRWSKSRHLRPWFLKLLRIDEGHSIQSGWDQFFGSNQVALLRITLDDGRVVGGFFGGGSLASYSQHSGDLYLEQRWELDEDDWFVAPAPGSLGFWVPHENIVSVEMYDPPTEPADADAPAA